MKMYKIDEVIEILETLEEEGNGFVGFGVNDEGNLLIVGKEHEPGWADGDGFGEATAEVELLEDVGEY